MVKFIKLPKLLFIFILAACISYVISYGIRIQSENLITIVLDDNGFSSGHAAIEKGTIVEWEIRGSNMHWPASNFHPTHENYPKGGGCIGSMLDACRAMKKGEKYSFQFDEVGTWHLHDHLNPGLTMSIQVQSDDKQDIQSSSRADVLNTTSYDKQKHVIKDMAKTDPESAWKLLKQTFIVDGQVMGNVHDVAHIIGNRAYNKFGLSGMRICDDEFAFGCYHGVSEKMLLALGKDSIKKIESECIKNWPPDETQKFTGCIHGTGHGLVAWRGLDLEKALIDCDVLMQRNRSYCYNGAMMEYMESAPRSAFDKNNPWKFCLKLDNEHYGMCGQYQIITFTTKFKFDFQQIINACSISPNADLKEACFHGLGSYIAQQAHGEFEDIRKKCMSILDKSGRSTCLTFAADQVVFQEYRDWENISFKLCGILKDTERNKCLLQRVQTISLYKKELLGN